MKISGGIFALVSSCGKSPCSSCQIMFHRLRSRARIGHNPKSHSLDKTKLLHCRSQGRQWPPSLSKRGEAPAPKASLWGWLRQSSDSWNKWNKWNIGNDLPKYKKIVSFSVWRWTAFHSGSRPQALSAPNLLQKIFLWRLLCQEKPLHYLTWPKNIQ